jgi:hypothetical protein
MGYLDLKLWSMKSQGNNMWLNVYFFKNYSFWVWWCTPIIPFTEEVEIGRMRVQGQPRQKLADPISTSKAVLVLYNCSSSYTGDVVRRITIWGQNGQGAQNLIQI